jgi:3-oxoacyl-[acyl-carrier protein] reductase
MSIRINLEGRIALVTGATGKLGGALVRTLAQCGADIGIHFFQNSGKARRLQAGVNALGRRACLVSGDVGELDAVLAMRDMLQRDLGDPDIVIANAVARIPSWETVLDEEPANYEAQFRSCVLHSVYMAKVFIPAMKKKGWGRFIGINTDAAMQTAPGQSAYASAKRGMDGVNRVLAREVGKYGITVNQVAPGWMITEDGQDSNTPEHAAYEQTVPLGRRGHAREVSYTVAFLASDLASFITGAYIPVCGGTVLPAI